MNNGKGIWRANRLNSCINIHAAARKEDKIMNRFRVKTEVCFGSNAIDALLQYRDVNAVIVTDPFMASSGNAELVAGKLCNCKKVSIFSEVKPDPPIELIATGLEFLLKEDADIVEHGCLLYKRAVDRQFGMGIRDA